MTQVTVKSNKDKVEKQILNDLLKGMERVGLLVENQAKINVTKSPPEHPQVQTGRLRSSLTHEITNTKDTITTEIGTNVVYSKYLEFGTSRMSPYPFLFPALEMKRKDITETLKGRNFGTELNYNQD